MLTIEMEVALMQYFKFTKNIIVPNVSWGIRINHKDLHECDLLILSESNYATEIEIKISISDLRADAKKNHKHLHDAIKKLYFAVPENISDKAIKFIPERAGIIIVKKTDTRFIITIYREPKINKKAVKWSDKEKIKLMKLGCMRIVNLKKKEAKNAR